jgi:hypothetical protein
MIRTEDLTRCYDGTLALDRLTMEVREGSSWPSWAPTAPAKPPPSACSLV